MAEWGVEGRGDFCGFLVLALAGVCVCRSLVAGFCVCINSAPSGTEAFVFWGEGMCACACACACVWLVEIPTGREPFVLLWFGVVWFVISSAGEIGAPY